MRGKKAKQIRKQVYGDLGSGPQFRKYKLTPGTERKIRKGKRREKLLNTGQLVADDMRRKYQKAKKRGRL